MKPKLILVHGALGAGGQYNSLVPLLENKYDVIVYEFPGHGNRANETLDFTIENLATDLEKFLSGLKEPAVVFGYSMGGYVALYLSKSHPQLFKSIITLGTKFHWTKEGSLLETSRMDAETMQLKVPQYCIYLESLHGIHWKKVLEQTKQLMIRLGEKPLLSADFCRSISIKTILMLGELDKMVTKEETEEIKNALPQSELKILEGFVHPLERLEAEKLAGVLSAL